MKVVKSVGCELIIWGSHVKKIQDSNRGLQPSQLYISSTKLRAIQSEKCSISVIYIDEKT